MFGIKTRQHDGICITLLRGKLNADTVNIYQEWDKSREDGAGQRIILDFSELAYLSSAGLRAILTTYRHAERNGTKLQLCGLSGIAKEVLQTAGLLTFMQVYPSVEEAIEQV